MPFRALPSRSQHPITRLLDELRGGSPGAQEELLPLVYEELHRIAEQLMRRQDAGHTLQATALVNEALLKLFMTNCAP